MGHKVTLGGDRLGAGKKQKVEIRGFERSNFDLGYPFKTTMSAGTLVPFMARIGLPGDTWGRRQVIMALTSRATHVLQWPVQRVAKARAGANPKKLVVVRIGVCNSTP